MQSGKPDTLVIGLGNPIKGDDAIGIFVVEELKKLAAAKGRADRFDMRTACCSNLELAEMSVGFKRLVIVDSVAVENERLGAIFQLKSPDPLRSPSRRRVKNGHAATTGLSAYENLHSETIFAALQRLRDLGARVPSAVEVFCINICREPDFSTEISPELAKNISLYASQIYEALDRR